MKPETIKGVIQNLLLTCKHQRAHSSALRFGHPLGQDHIHGRIGRALPQAHNEPRAQNAHCAETARRQGRCKCGQGGHQEPEPEDIFAPVPLGDEGPWDVIEDVAPEEGA